MILNECREEWERGFEEVGVFPSSTGGTYVILKYNEETYHLHSYYVVDDQWTCSIKVNGGSLEQCVRELSDAIKGE